MEFVAPAERTHQRTSFIFFILQKTTQPVAQRLTLATQLLLRLRLYPRSV